MYIFRYKISLRVAFLSTFIIHKIYIKMMHTFNNISSPFSSQKCRCFSWIHASYIHIFNEFIWFDFTIVKTTSKRELSIFKAERFCKTCSTCVMPLLVLECFAISELPKGIKCLASPVCLSYIRLTVLL